MAFANMAISAVSSTLETALSETQTHVNINY